MAQGYDRGYSWPVLNWKADDLLKEWERFYQHCEFVFGGPLAKCNEKEKICNLMNFVGDKGREMYSCFDWKTVKVGSNDVSEKEILERVAGKFKEQLESKRNPIMAAVLFDRRRQQPGESFNDFVTDLRVLARGLGLSDTDKLVRNAIACKSLDERVRQRCLEKGAELTLEKSIELGRQCEATKEGLKIIDGEDRKVTVNKISHEYKFNRQNKHKQNDKPNKHKANKHKVNTSQNGNCRRCGYESHQQGQKCPAKSEVCKVCRKRGHYAKVCRNRKVNMLEECSSDESSDEDVRVLEILSVNEETLKASEEWMETVMIESKMVKCQLDTGAKVSVMSVKQLNSVKPDMELKPTNKRLVSYSEHTIVPLGYALLIVSHKNVKCQVKFYIVDNHQKPVLSGEACKALGLIQRIHPIDADWKETLKEFPDLEKTTGTLPGTYTIKIDPTATPVVHAPRKQAASRLPAIKDKLREMESQGYLVKVTEPTDWVNSMVVSTRGNKVRICIDPTDLNKAIRREHYPLPTIEEVVAYCPDAKLFSVLDAKSGYLQIPLTYESSILTTMNTPLGRYRWTRLPFGIKSAPEMFQRIMDEMLSGIEYCRAVMDDILVAGRDKEHHDQVLRQVLERAQSYNLKLNFDKVRIRKTEVPYVGHVITADGLKPDPNKVKAVLDMPHPDSKEAVRRFLGFIQYLSKFLPMLAEVEVPLRELTRNDVQFHWDKPQEDAFQQLKELCCKTPVLAFYDVNKPTTIQCDASNYAIGAVLLQEGRPIAYTSRKLNASEINYVPIEKEMLAIVYSTQKFREYILGKETKVQTDHKPLETIYHKPLIAAPLRLQTMLLKVKGYDLKVEYLPGKKQFIADALSRASSEEPTEEDIDFKVNMIDRMSVSKAKYSEFQRKTANELNELYVVILKGWPSHKQQVPQVVRPYWNVRDELSILDGIIYRGMRIVVPPSMITSMLDIIHETHLGIVKSKERARDTLYWPGMNAQIEEKIGSCTTCQTYQAKQAKEPMIARKLPDLPWTELASDVLFFEGEHYIVTVDYYSKYIEVSKLTDLSTQSTIQALSSHFATHGIPERLTTDNGTHYASAEFTEFARNYNFEHVTISPHHSCSNGEAEAAVKTVKRMWRKNKDKQLALLDYRSTPLPEIGLSPSQLLMSRRLRTKLPTARTLLEPKPIQQEEVMRRMKQTKEKQKTNYDKHAGRELPPLAKGDVVRVSPQQGSKEWKLAKVVDLHNSPRSYIVQCGARNLRRNRGMLRKTTETFPNSTVAHDSHVHDDKQQHLPSTSQKAKTQPDPTEASNSQPKPLETVKSKPKPQETIHPQVKLEESADQPYVTRRGRSVKKPNRLDL